MQIKLGLALLMQGKHIIYLMKSVAEVRTQNRFQFYIVMKQTSLPLCEVAEKFNQNFVNVPNIIRQSIKNVPPIAIPDNDKS